MEVWALIDSKSKVNEMLPIYAKKLDLQMQKTDVETQKINESTLEIYGIVIGSF